MSILGVVEGGRRLVTSTLLDRCVILDSVNAPDDSGGTTTVLVPRALDVPCRFGTLSETDVRVIAGAAHGPATAVLTLPIEVDVDEGAFIQNVDVQSSFWLVVGDRTPESHLAVARRVLIREAKWHA